MVGKGKDPLVKLASDWQTGASANSVDASANSLDASAKGSANTLDSEKEIQESASFSAPRILKDPKTGRFLPGNRPPGRPAGCVSSVTKARQVLANHTEELIGLALEQVRQGKANALLAELLRFSMPQARSQLAAIAIPGAADAMAMGDFDGALAEITRATLDGEISPDAAKVATEQVKSAEEAKRLRALAEQVEKLSAKVIEGQARRVS
ncbi:MAG: hypothetical protein FGM35_02520 [Rhodocyclaceae bacterium]|nr:hypothetical protein [Rhodocyclaceae bacterium]